MAVIDHLDLSEKRIYLALGVRQYHSVEDIYKEIRYLRRTDETLRGFDIPIMAYGNVPKGGGKFTPRYAMFRLGWKIIPEDTSQTLTVMGEQITDEGEAGPACIDLSTLSPTSKIIVEYEPPQAEVIVIETGVSGLTEEESDQLMALPQIGDIEASPVLAKQTELVRTLGLMQENYFMDQCQYQTNNNNQKQMVSGRIRIYSSPTSVGTDNDVIGTYQITAVWSDKEMTSYKAIRE